MSESLDERVVLNPVLLDSGIRMFDGDAGSPSLTLTTSKAYDSSHMLLHCSIVP